MIQLLFKVTGQQEKDRCVAGIWLKGNRLKTMYLTYIVQSHHKAALGSKCVNKVHI